MIRRLLTLALFFLLIGCASNPPKTSYDNICLIYDHDDTWENAARASAKKWGTPEYILMAFVHQESRFKHDARPEREYVLGLIPLPRRSSSYGYSQAQNPAWFDYQKSTGKRGASRSSIYDSLDFIGWYNYQSHQRIGISRQDAYNLYLAYHEGQGGYSRGSHHRKRWLLEVAQKVKRRAQLYKTQLRNCGAVRYPNTQPNNRPIKPKKPCNAPWPYC